MPFTPLPTVAPGDSWSASQHNTYLRDNLAALWPYLATGDITYLQSPGNLARLAIGSAGQVLTVSPNLPALPVWANIPSPLHARGVVSTVGIQQSTTSTAPVDITGAVINLSLTKPCTIVVIGNAVGFAGSGGGSYNVRFDLLIDGTAVGAFDSYNPYPGSVCLVAYKAGVLSGTRTIKARFLSPFSISVHTYGVYLNAFAIAE